MVLLKIFCIPVILAFSSLCFAIENSEIYFERPEKNLSTKTLKRKIFLKVELALNSEDQQKGLMFRKVLNNDSGMLFVFKDEALRSFWMKNTLIPLSIAFIDSNNTIFQIADLNPVKTLAEQKYDSVSSIKPAQYVLEVNRNWFSQKNISVGDKFIWPDSKKFLSGK